MQVTINSDATGQINFIINLDGTDNTKTYKVRIRSGYEYNEWFIVYAIPSFFALQIETETASIEQENEASIEFTLQPYASKKVLQVFLSLQVLITISSSRHSRKFRNSPWPGVHDRVAVDCRYRSLTCINRFEHI